MRCVGTESAMTATDQRLTPTQHARLSSAMAGTWRELACAYRDLGIGLRDGCTLPKLVEVYLTLANLSQRHGDELAREASHYRGVAAYEDALPLAEGMAGGDTPSRPSITASALQAVRIPEDT